MEERSIWFRGSIVPARDATVNVLSPTAQFGLNVFEGIRCYWNPRRQQLYAFRLAEHFARLQRSCKLIGLPCPYGAAEMEGFMVAVLRHNGYREDVAVRMTVFADGEGSWSSTGPVDMFIAPAARRRTDLQTLKGLAGCVSTWQRIGDTCLPPRIKAGANYINGRYGFLEAKRNGYDVPVFLAANGKVSESAGACLFLVRDGVLATPPLTSSVLESITRATLIDLAAGLGIPVDVREVDRTELYIADEVLLCGSAAEVTPVVSMDRIPVGSGAPGPVTVSLLKAYLDHVSNEPGARSEWLTPIHPAGLP